MSAQGGRVARLKDRLAVLAIAVFSGIAASSIAAASADRKPFGIVDEPLYAPGAIALAASMSGAGPAQLDTILSSHPPFGSLLLGLGLLGPPIFPPPTPSGPPGTEALCAISSGSHGTPAIVQRTRLERGWGLRVETGTGAAPSTVPTTASISAQPMSCIDLIDRAAVLLSDGSIVIASAPLDQSAQPLISDPLEGPWSAIAPLGEGGGGGILARASDGVWWRVDDPVNGGGKVSTGFSGEQLVGIGSVARLDGSDAGLDRVKAEEVAGLLSACGSTNCGGFVQRLLLGNAYLNGDVDADARAGFRERLASIAPIAYGHARAAIGLVGNRIVLVDLDHADMILASVPFTATKLRMALSRVTADGFRIVLTTKGRIYSVVASLFPSPNISLTATSRFHQIDGVYPAGGDGLLAVAMRDDLGGAHLQLMDSLRLQVIEGRLLDEPLTELGPYAVSLHGTRHSMLVANTSNSTVTIDTSSASARLRLPVFVAVGVLLGAAVMLAGASGVAGAIAAALALMVSPSVWDLATVGMLDGLLAAILAVALVAAVASLDASRVDSRRFFLFGAGVFTGVAAGVKLSALIAGAPVLAVAAATTSWIDAASIARRVLVVLAAFGAVVAASALFAGAGFGAALNIFACAAITVLAMRIRGEVTTVSIRSRLAGLTWVATGAIAGILVAFLVPVLVGIEMGGSLLALGDALRIWISAGAKIAEGFLIDHPLGLPFWGLALGLGVGFGGSVAPGVFAALWAGIGTRAGPLVRRRFGPDESAAVADASARISGLLLFSALTMVVWAPLSRILFPWYGATTLVPLAAAFGMAFSTRDRRLVPMAVGAACGPAIAWLTGPTLCLAAVSRLDRGCQAIGATDIAGTAVLVCSGLAASVAMSLLLRWAARHKGALPRHLRRPGLLLFGAIVGTVAIEVIALAVTAGILVTPLRAFPVVVAMELIWGGATAALLVGWRRISAIVPLLFGASTLLLEGARAIGIPVYLRPWYEAATQVGRVIPQPLLHPVPLIFVASAGLLLGLAAALLPVESIVRYCRQSWRSSRMYFRKNKS